MHKNFIFSVAYAPNIPQPCHVSSWTPGCPTLQIFVKLSNGHENTADLFDNSVTPPLTCFSVSYQRDYPIWVSPSFHSFIEMKAILALHDSHMANIIATMEISPYFVFNSTIFQGQTKLLYIRKKNMNPNLLEAMPLPNFVYNLHIPGTIIMTFLLSMLPLPPAIPRALPRTCFIRPSNIHYFYPPIDTTVDYYPRTYVKQETVSSTNNL